MHVATVALDLTGTYAPGAAIVAGLAGAVAMLVVIYTGKAAGMTSMDLVRTLGAMVAPGSDATVVYAFGLPIHRRNQQDHRAEHDGLGTLDEAGRHRDRRTHVGVGVGSIRRSARCHGSEKQPADRLHVERDGGLDHDVAHQVGEPAEIGGATLVTGDLPVTSVSETAHDEQRHRRHPW